MSKIGESLQQLQNELWHYIYRRQVHFKVFDGLDIKFKKDTDIHAHNGL